jgi:hypothetical protein
VKIDTQIEVTMTMNLAEAKIIRDSLEKAGSAVPGSYAVYADVRDGLDKVGVR